MSIRSLVLIACSSLMTPMLPAQDLTFLPRSTPARFSLSPAGARALGLGGAFVAVADDPTAADVNPAGLGRLEGPQLLVSLRSSSFDTELEGGLAGPGVTTSQSVSDPAFAGYSQPLGPLTLAAYYQQDGRFESGARFELSPELLALWATPFLFDERRFDQKIETLGLAGGARLSPAVSVGAALRYQRLSLGWLDELGVDATVFDPSSAVPPILRLRGTVDDHDTDVTAVVGLLVHPKGRWTGGVSYQQGGDFRLTGIFQPLVAFPIPAVREEVPMKVPDVLNAGATFRPHDRWLLSAQVSRLTYSDLDGEPTAHIDVFPFIPTIPLFTGDEPIDDGTRVHLGAEVRLGPQDRPFTVRAGVWRDPDHDGIRNIDSEEINGTLGAGVLLGGRWGLDAAVRAGDTVKEGVLAVCYRT